MTRNAIGDYLGLTIETISRTITKLRNLGVIDLDETHVVNIRDERALRAVAAGQ